MQNYPRQTYPKVDGMYGPIDHEDGTVYYQDIRTNKMYGIRDVFPTVQGYNGPLSNPHTSAIYYTNLETNQNVTHGQIMDMINQAHQVPQSTFPSPQQQMPGQNIFPNQTQQQGQIQIPQSNSKNLYNRSDMPSIGIRDTHSAVAPYRGDSVIKTNIPDNVSIDMPSNALKVVGKTLFTLENQDNDNSSVAHSHLTHAIVPMADNAGNLIETIVEIGRITLNKEEHMIPEYESGVETTKEIVTEAPLPVEEVSNVLSFVVDSDNKFLDTTTLSEAALITRYYHMDEPDTVCRFTVRKDICMVEREDPLLMPLIKDEWLEHYDANYDDLLEKYPVLVNTIDRELKSIVNNILRNVLSMTTSIGKTYHADHKELFDFLHKMGRSDSFYSYLADDLLNELKISIYVISLEGKEFDLISTSYESVIAVHDVESTDTLVTGHISNRITPSLYLAASALRAASVVAGYKYRHIYIAGIEGGILKIASSSTTVPALAMHTLVSVIN